MLSKSLLGIQSANEIYPFVAALFAILVLHKLIIYPFILSPVKAVPGPWWARISKIPLQYATYKRRRTEFASNLLQQYGPIVVIAPDQIHTTDETAMKIIYDKSAIKTSFYQSMGSWKGVISTLGFLDYKSAAPSRNNLIQVFQNRNLETLVESFESHIHDFVNLLKRNDSTPLDGVVVFRLLALDIVTDVLWGEQDRLLAAPQGTGAMPVFLRRFHAFSTWNATKSFIPGADLFVRLCGSTKWRQLRQDCNDMDVTARNALKRWLQSQESDAQTSSQRQKDVLSMLQNMNSAKAPVVPVEHLPAYMVEMLAAGSSTTSHTLAFACWLLSRHPKVQDELHEELKHVSPDIDSIELSQLSDLPLLDAVIRETMRLYPMIPGPLERHLGQSIQVGDFTIPPGIIASTSAYSQGRLEDVFPDSDSWRPHRWLDASERMKLNWTPFGHGSRACPGSNLAMTELRYILGTIFRIFQATVPDGHQDDTLELADVFAAGSKSGHCWLQFSHLDD